MRDWIFGQLKTDPQLQEFHRGRVAASGSLLSTPEKPFFTYRLGNQTDENLADEQEATGPRRQFFQVDIHDEPSDYTRIDAMVNRTISLLGGQVVPVHHILHVRYLETSRDLDDPTYESIFRYIRFQAVLAQ